MANKEIKLLGDIFEKSVRNFPDKLALKKGDTEYTYQTLKDEVIKLKNYLLSLGLKKGNKFAVIGENSPEWAVSYLAILRAGLVCIPLDRLLSEAELLHILNTGEAVGVISSKNYIYKIEAIKPRLKNLKWLISMDKIKDLKSEKEFGEIEIKSDSLAVLIFTSGTTGQSKAVMLSHKNIISNIQAIEKFIYIDENDTMVSIIPMHHTFEATCGFLFTLYRGGAIYYTPSLKPNDILATMKQAKVTCLIAVPLLFEKFISAMHRKVAAASPGKKILFNIIRKTSSVAKFLRKPLFARVRKEMGLGNLRLAVTGGAALTERVRNELELLGIPIIQGYGLTEAAPVVSVNPLNKARNNSVGIPLPGVEVKIDNPDSNGVGEILVRGPNVMLGYYKNAKETNKVIKNGWLYTGDLGKFDRNGYLYITGRNKSLIVTQTGKNIYPEELEEKLSFNKWIKEVLVVPRIDPVTKKEVICALIYPDYELLESESITKGIKITEQEIQNIYKDVIRSCNEDLPVYKRITTFEIRKEEFPKTTTHKIKRHIFISRTIRV